MIFAGALQGADDAGQQEIRAREKETDVGIGLERVDDAGLRFLLVPLGGDARDDVDRGLVAFHGGVEAVAAADGVDVAEVADEDHGLVFAAGLLRLGDQVGDGFLREGEVVGDDGDGAGVAFVGGTVEEDDGNVGGVRGLDYWDAGLGVLRDEDDAVDFARDEIFDLLELAVGVAVGNGFEHRVAAFL